MVTQEMESARDERASPSAALRRRRLAAKMFGVVEDEPVRFGRFVLMGHLGSGGVGTVHLAYDPQLDRRVALKLLGVQRAGSEASRKRMLREAKLLARLSDPNIVPVYEAGILDDQVFIVMEFVVGKTLGDWVVDSKPSWEEILAVYMQAGRGLAAAHAVGLIHRDFKPANALRGEDERVRVLDFGLAKVSAPETTTQDDAPAGPASASVPVPASASAAVPVPVPVSQDDAFTTAVGTIMGTPAYMAPEQFSDADVGPEADQFSFCVALFEALYEARPFTPRHRRDPPSGVVAEPGESPVPRWVFAALRRGLAIEAEARHPSMEALLAELDRGLGRKRRIRQLFAGVGAALVVVLSVALSRLSPEPAGGPALCSGGADELATVWGPGPREAVGRALLSTDLAYAEELRPEVESRLTDYAERWQTLHREACEVHLRGEQSDSLFDLRMVCLERRLASFASAIEVLQGTRADGLAKALEIVDGLPKLDHCADAERLGREVPPPDSPELAAQVGALRERLGLAEALEHGGRYAEALTLADTLVDEARASTYAPVLVEALLVRGRVRLGQRQFESAADSLREATLLGFEVGLDAVALEALARELYARGMLPGRASSALAELPLAEALTKRTPEAAFARALLLNNAGTVYVASGQRERARELFAAAIEISTAADLRGWELANIRLNLALVEPQAERRRALAAEAVELLEAALGPFHPQTLVATYVYSHQLDDPHRAAELRAKVCERYASDHVGDEASTRECWYSLGFLESELGDDAKAIAAFDAVVALGPSEAEAVMIEVAAAYAMLLRGRAREALASFDAILPPPRDSAAAQPELESTPEQWWLSRHVARALIGKADAHRFLGEPEREREALDQAATRLVSITAQTDDADLERARARVEARLASVREPVIDPR